MSTSRFHNAPRSTAAPVAIDHRSATARKSPGDRPERAKLLKRELSNTFRQLQAQLRVTDADLADRTCTARTVVQRWRDPDAREAASLVNLTLMTDAEFDLVMRDVARIRADLGFAHKRWQEASENRRGDTDVRELVEKLQQDVTVLAVKLERRK